MEGGEPLTGLKKLGAIATWHALTAIVKLGHRILQLCGLHKQYTNRWLEPVVWVDGVITSTDWANFLKLRAHPSAQPEMQILALLIEEELASNVPDLLKPGECHLPYIDEDDVEEYSIDELCLISAGRNARVSYGFKDTKDSKADIERARKLLSANPKHFSPFEHIACCPLGMNEFKSGNFRNWTQFRKILEYGVG